MIKDYLSAEMARNKTMAPVLTRMIQMAYGRHVQVLVGHHLCMEEGTDINTENEIPSIDTLIFDHEIMKRIFGPEVGIAAMQRLASLPCEERDAELTSMMDSCLVTYQPQDWEVRARANAIAQHSATMALNAATL